MGGNVKGGGNVQKRHVSDTSRSQAPARGDLGRRRKGAGTGQCLAKRRCCCSIAYTSNLGPQPPSAGSLMRSVIQQAIRDPPMGEEQQHVHRHVSNVMVDVIVLTDIIAVLPLLCWQLCLLASSSTRPTFGRPRRYWTNIGPELTSFGPKSAICGPKSTEYSPSSG